MAAWACALGGLMNTAQCETLTLARMFAAPDLSGPTLRTPQFSPDGQLLAYLQGSADDKDRLDLWAYDLRTRKRRLLIDARALAPGEASLSPEEAARRERQRTSALRGIVEYQFSSDSRSILIPLAGDLYVYDLGAPPATAVRRITAHSGEPAGSATDARFSPQGHYVSFIRDQNLYVYAFATDRVQRITPDCRALVSCGVAEFIAQEEMDRSTGYWWSPDESRIAWARVDESPVPEVERFEINANDVRVVPQRYPAAGQPNASVRLFVTTLAEPATIEIPFSQAPRPQTPGDPPQTESQEPYLARVGWFPDSRSLAIQRESRDQKTLDLIRSDPFTGKSRVLLTERSDTWIELNDELSFIPGRGEFLWASSRTGFRHLYLYDFDGHLLCPVTAGDWMVVGDRRGRAIRGLDEKRGLVYFEANRETPLERNLYVSSYRHPGPTIERLTREPGWHGIQMPKNTAVYLDRYSTADRPPSVTLRALSGRSLAELDPNPLDASHPYFNYLDTRPTNAFGTLVAEDGQELYYELTTPAHLEPGRRYPVIVEVYGGPGVQFVANQWADQSGFFDHILTQHGFVVFKLDNRGSGERGNRFESALYRRLSIVEVRDQVRGVEFLKTLPFVDPTRIGVFGWSYGGYMALMCLLQAPQEFAAGIAGAPVTDWRLYDTHYTERYLGTPADDPSGYQLADVLHYAGALRAPMLLMHGMADDNVLFTNSTTLMKRLQDLGKPFDLMTYPGAKHSLLRHADTGPHAYGRILRFLDENLGAQTAHPVGQSDAVTD
jgi:dipeptidyl-peptidase-4